MLALRVFIKPLLFLTISVTCNNDTFISILHLKTNVMSQRILVTNYSFNVSSGEFEGMINQIAPQFCEVPGLEWKIYLIDREKQQAGGIYLFRDDDALQSFKLSPLVASILAHPALGDFDLREKDILEAPSLVNFAPLQRRETLASV
jgi:hypothetical protein